MLRLTTLGVRVTTLDTRTVKPQPKQTDPHYLSPQHRRWRADVLRRAGYRCEKCGADGKLYADHIVELKDGGAPLDPANGRALCHSCHQRKTAEARAERLMG
jgi:5-methylcytosine-specific restriction enzyme A